jgi:hypothetical protein
MDWLANALVMAFLIGPPGVVANKSTTGPTFIECLPKWQDGGLTRPEKCNHSSNDGGQNGEEKGR